MGGSSCRGLLGGRSTLQEQELCRKWKSMLCTEGTLCNRPTAAQGKSVCLILKLSPMSNFHGHYIPVLDILQPG